MERCAEKLTAPHALPAPHALTAPHALAAPHDTQVVLAASFHHPGGQPELGTQSLFVASHQ